MFQWEQNVEKKKQIMEIYSSYFSSFMIVQNGNHDFLPIDEIVDSLCINLSVNSI